jgi:DNA-binding transcriptional MerR regulator
MDIPSIPEQEYYTIGEVARNTSVKPYTLREWEKHFARLTPIRKSTNQRRYNKDQIEFIFKIKDLLYNKKYTIKGAKKHLNEEKRLTKMMPELKLKEELLPQSAILKEIRSELKQVLKLLKK